MLEEIERNPVSQTLCCTRADPCCCNPVFLPRPPLVERAAEQVWERNVRVTILDHHDARGCWTARVSFRVLPSAGQLHVFFLRQLLTASASRLPSHQLQFIKEAPTEHHDGAN